MEAVADWLRECIFTGELDLGERLIELKLAKKAGVGQPTVREALKELEHQGFVRRTPKHGTYVTRLTRDEFQKLHEVRMALESVAIERAAVRIGDNEIDDLRHYVGNMEVAAKSFDRIEFHRHDMAFHRQLWHVADNEFLAAALEQVVAGLFAFFLMQRKQGDVAGLTATARFHTPIIDALRTRDPAHARTVFMDQTLAFWHKQYTSLF